MAANTPAGSYTVVVRATAAGNSTYASGTADSTVSITVESSKLPNPITYNDQSWVTSKSVSSQTKTINVASNAVGTVTYSIESQSSGDYFSLSGLTLTIAANTPVGDYYVSVVAAATGDNTYASGTASSLILISILNSFTIDGVSYIYEEDMTVAD